MSDPKMPTALVGGPVAGGLAGVEVGVVVGC